jgi:hypothetical protein
MPQISRRDFVVNFFAGDRAERRTGDDGGGYGQRNLPVTSLPRNPLAVFIKAISSVLPIAILVGTWRR